MKVYRVTGEGELRYVEATSFGEAIRLFMAAMVTEFGPDSGWDAPGAEPEQVELMSDEPVIR